MATTTLTLNPQKVTVPANTNEHDIDFDSILSNLGQQYGLAAISEFSGTVSFNANNQAIAAGSGTYTTGSKALIPIKQGVKLRFKGGSGSETFVITIHRP